MIGPNASVIVLWLRKLRKVRTFDSEIQAWKEFFLVCELGTSARHNHKVAPFNEKFSDSTRL